MDLDFLCFIKAVHFGRTRSACISASATWSFTFVTASSLRQSRVFKYSEYFTSRSVMWCSEDLHIDYIRCIAMPGKNQRHTI